jgi:hypothetical protein
MDMQTPDKATVKVPLLLRIFLILMWLMCINLIFTGIFTIIAPAIIFIILGIFVAKYGIALRKMEYRGYKGGLIVNGVSIVMTLLSLALDPSTFGAQHIISIIFSFVFMGILFMYKDKFQK